MPLVLYWWLVAGGWWLVALHRQTGDVMPSQGSSAGALSLRPADAALEVFDELRKTIQRTIAKLADVRDVEVQAELDAATEALKELNYALGDFPANGWKQLKIKSDAFAELCRDLESGAASYLGQSICADIARLAK